MAELIPSMPLLALKVTVLDTETTGLDATSAHLVQIGAVRVTGETLDPEDRFLTLVNPGVPIPPASTRIHHIADADVVTAPKTADALTALAEFVGDTVIVGHTIGYDLEILRREAERSGTKAKAYRALDVRLLARVAAPSLADYGLDALCAWLGIEIEGRHSAMGDALATAKVFTALVPRLRQAGVRTLAEAEATSRTAGEREEMAAGGPGALRLPEAPKELPLGGRRIDSYPYSHRVGDLMSAPPIVLPVASTLREATALLIERGISSAFVEGADGELGIITERDVLRVLQAKGEKALDTPLSEIWSRPLQTVRREAFAYRAIGRMERLKIRHLGVVDETGKLVGAVTTRNLLRHRASAAMTLGDELAAGQDLAALGAAWAKLPLVAKSLSDEGVDAHKTAGVISSEICMLTRRAAVLSEQRMADAGRGGPPLPYAVLVLGSAGRGESLLSADQDNAIVYKDAMADSSADQWFEEMATHLADVLDEVGVPYCKGGVMAKNAVWRRNLEDWKATVDDWIGRKNPEDLLNVDIFYDGVAVHGDRSLGEALAAHAYSAGSQRPTFWRALGETLRTWRSPIKFLGGFRTDREDRVDLKLNGLFPLVAAARIVAIKTGTAVRSTAERLRAAATHDLASSEQIEKLIEAHRIILDAMLRQQIADSEAGIAPSPRVDPKILSKREREALSDAIGTVPQAIDLVREGML